MPYVVTLLNWMPIFEWYMARHEVENRHQRGVCYLQRKDNVLKHRHHSRFSREHHNREQLCYHLESMMSSLWTLVTFASLLNFWSLKGQCSWFITIVVWMRQLLSLLNSQNVWESAHNRNTHLSEGCVTSQLYYRTKHLLLARYIKKLSRVKLSDLLGSEEWPA